VYHLVLFADKQVLVAPLRALLWRDGVLEEVVKVRDRDIEGGLGAKELRRPVAGLEERMFLVQAFDHQQHPVCVGSFIVEEEREHVVLLLFGAVG
jgi:hypothetical protein